MSATHNVNTAATIGDLCENRILLFSDTVSLIEDHVKCNQLMTVYIKMQFLALGQVLQGMSKRHKVGCLLNRNLQIRCREKT